jgi:hypothetical protein
VWGFKEDRNEETIFQKQQKKLNEIGERERKDPSFEMHKQLQKVPLCFARLQRTYMSFSKTKRPKSIFELGGTMANVSDHNETDAID